MAKRSMLTRSVAAAVASVSENIKEIYPEIFYINGFKNLCDDNTLRAKNIKFAIMIDRIPLENKENFNRNGQGDNGFDDGTYGFGSDIQILDITVGNPGKPRPEILRTCDQIANFLQKARNARQSSIIVDNSGDEQKIITIVCAYLIYHETQCFYKAFGMVSKYNPKINLNKYYTDILMEYEYFIHTKLKQMNSIKIVKNVTNEFMRPKRFNASCDPYHIRDHEEKCAMVKHLNEGKPMETFVSVFQKEKNYYDLQHPYNGGAGEWNYSIQNDLFVDDLNDESANKFD